MKTTETVRTALGFADQGVRVLESMKDAPLVQPGPFGGNHAMWILGHVTIAEGRLHKILFGSPNPVEHWKPLFDWGSEPTTDSSAYPPFDEVLQTYRRLRSKTLAFLDEIGDEGLDQPTKVAPPGLEAAFATVGKAVMSIAMHQIFHNGEAAAARRASGQQPIFVPSKELRAF
ncbi:MAG TPA: DinB family protein [bacterium]|nr:DinB family protein [bacterium]